MWICANPGPPHFSHPNPRYCSVFLVQHPCASRQLTLTPRVSAEAGAWFHKPRCPPEDTKCQNPRTKVRTKDHRNNLAAIQTKRHMELFAGGRSPFSVPPIDVIQDGRVQAKVKRRDRSKALRAANRIQRRKSKGDK